MLPDEALRVLDIEKNALSKAKIDEVYNSHLSNN
jgi:hypothetical protein